MKRLFYSLLCTTLLFPLCGCLPTVQLEERAIVQAAAVDHSGENYQLTLQIFDPSNNSENTGGNDSFVLAKSFGKNLTEAFQQFESQSGQQIFLGNCQILLIGSDSISYIRGILDYFNSRPQTRATMMAALTEGSATALMENCSEKIPLSPSTQIEEELRLAEKDKRILPCRLMDILAALETPGRDGLLPMIKLDDSGDQAKPILNGGVAFVGNSPGPVLSADELITLGWCKQGEANIALSVDSPTTDMGLTSVVLEKFQCDLSTQLSGSTPHLAIHIKTKGRVSECAGLSADRLDANQLTAAEQAIESDMTEHFDLLLKKLCASGCDPLRFGERLFRSDPKSWNNIGEQNWPALLRQAQWEIQTECDLTTYAGH